MAKLGYPFTLGVASGEPLPSGVILWTRLAPEPLHSDPDRPGGMPERPVEVQWQVAADEAFTRIVRHGTKWATADDAHSVRVRVDGLHNATDYYYRFLVTGPFAAANSPVTSPVGRTRTAPGPMSTDPLTFGLVSCQRYEHGFYPALRHLAAERPDVVFHVGDYIYEYGKPANPRPGRYMRPLTGGAAECKTLHAYRNRYALYRMDPDLQAAHAAAPWVPTWDDHEVRDNYRGGLPGDGSDPAAFMRRRTDAYQAYFEHMPLRAAPAEEALQIYRRCSYGEVADFMVLDVRQYRSDTSMLGAAQEEWLLSRLRGTMARWSVLVQPLFFAKRVIPGRDPGARSDAWDGYPAFRDRLIAARPRGLVVLSGDVHDHWAAEIKADFADPASPAVGVEFVGTSVTSKPPETDVPAVLAANPHLKFHDGRRGYVMGKVSMDSFEVSHRVVESTDSRESPVSTAATFGVEDGRLVRKDKPGTPAV
ncbi:alkaline phosphatase D family protein [Sinosporangium siamense]|uniref:Alkaline phosphatase D n=1 Tax=Sinosporangium siamense TaxID=1367973 RepID=A0A919V2E3_9ACTN|nr:alkaline phosphatase D family protein [Sinosporangium siamense]GII89820.1 alkaline phosphatase D [Sinosporangium siamense]